MAQRKRYSFSLKLKLVVFTTVLALITYSSSAFFIYYVSNFTETIMNEETFILITLLLGIIWSGVLTYFGAGFITRALHKLEEAAYRAADGDIQEDVELPKSDDEIKGLTIAFNQMLKNMRDMVQSIEGNFHETSERVSQMTNSSTNLAKQAEAISTTVQEISRGADQSATSIQETAASIEDIIEFASQVENKAITSEKMSKEMVDSLTESKKVYDSLITGIQKLAKENETSMISVRRLEEHANEVSMIVSLVGDIANQTNLLALNASIEAARAGEHGKGFAVVAEEVRKLADESGKAVQGITNLIENIQQEVHNVVGQIGEQVEIAKAQAENGLTSGKMLDQTSQSIIEVANAVSQISELIHQQMDSLQMTGAQSEEVAAIAQQSSAGAQEVAATIIEQTENIEQMRELSTKLAESADKLRKTIDRFNIQTVE
ncbi:methyl-accepting chemotaxis protein [Metabacillus malikii]|uniref:Methyl-accepting chemotaxis protein n=1 Tax=Metabacillus malikii TaxID=1504265 RepID=A0ABT9ZIP1_9BACI|nr:HAMP domain-containing methyl-accepting chemotaxis protein [Metabacillus malikii]MDQ0232136.1 methyl-accepting chemotaxis protein [Metabacillus malikii]